MLRACDDAKCFKIKSCLCKTTPVLVLNKQLHDAPPIFHFKRNIFHTVNLIVSDIFIKIIFLYALQFHSWSNSTTGQFIIRALAGKIGDMIRDQVRILYLLFLCL